MASELRIRLLRARAVFLLASVQLVLYLCSWHNSSWYLSNKHVYSRTCAYVTFITVAMVTAGCCDMTSLYTLTPNGFDPGGI